MSFLKITLRRSAIGLPRRTTGVLMALGLRRRGQAVVHPAEPQFAGMVMAVKELVRVEEVPAMMTGRQMREARRPDRGFEVVGRLRADGAGVVGRGGGAEAGR